MAKGRSTSGILLSAAIFILLEFAAVALLSSSSQLQNIWLNRASHHLIGWVWGTSDNIRSYFSLRERNRVLEEENALLSEQLRNYREMQVRDSLRSSFSAPDDGFRYIFAKTAKISIGAQHNHVVLNKGYSDEVSERCGIITNQGVIGVIDAVDRNYSYGRTLMNPNISVSVKVDGTEIAGPMTWDGKSTDRALMRGVPLFQKLHEGDTVRTSGYSSIFPAGIPVGTVEGSTTRNGATQDVAIKLFQDFSAVDYVAIVRNEDREQIDAIEKRGMENDKR